MWSEQVGDFGILVRSGFSVFKALAFNFLSALVAMAGTALVQTISFSCSFIFK
jgi:zinc transporter 7